MSRPKDNPNRALENAPKPRTVSRSHRTDPIALRSGRYVGEDMSPHVLDRIMPTLAPDQLNRLPIETLEWIAGSGGVVIGSEQAEFALRRKDQRAIVRWAKVAALAAITAIIVGLIWNAYAHRYPPQLPAQIEATKKLPATK